jgi:tRNA(adenine34) deaminase
VFGAWDEKAGAAGSLYDVVRDRRLPSRAEVVAGVRADQASDLLRGFFESRR